jgi:hypothetical protein
VPQPTTITLTGPSGSLVDGEKLYTAEVADTVALWAGSIDISLTHGGTSSSPASPIVVDNPITGIAAPSTTAFTVNFPLGDSTLKVLLHDDADPMFEIESDPIDVHVLSLEEAAAADPAINVVTPQTLAPGAT